MISPKYFIETLSHLGIEFFTGVPDSLLKALCAYIIDNYTADNNIIAANEGNAIGLASGYYLATGKIPAVYMQNSGLGNSINPLLSLTDVEVFNIPLLLLIGWRGEPGIKDEPQHIKQGKLTIPLLDTMGIRYAVLSSQENDCLEQLKAAVTYINETMCPFAFVIRKNTFEQYKSQRNNTLQEYSLTRENAIRIVADSLFETDIIVSTTGMISRELFEYRESLALGHDRDFLVVGSMGHASQIALGIALQKQSRNVFCFDGDGSVLMHLGSMAIIGSLGPCNFSHIVFNNGAHDSVGGQPTVGLQIDLRQIALACGYVFAFSVDDAVSLKNIMEKVKNLEGPIFIEVKVMKGDRKDLGRPTLKPIQNRDMFIKFVRS
jgi:phosphonopyruvate decarboxylase